MGSENRVWATPDCGRAAGKVNLLAVLARGDRNPVAAALEQLADVAAIAYHTAGSALEWAAAHPADVVVVEHREGELDAPKFIESFRNLADRQFAVVVMVAGDETETRHRGARAGANEFARLPVEPVELEAHLRNALLMARHRRELLERSAAALESKELETLFKLARAAEFRDDVTGMHIVRVGHMTAALARAMGLPQRDCDVLAQAAPMHDIGKIAVPDDILLKPGPLTPDEFAVMRRHAAAGYDILKGGDSPILRAAAEIALTHHERWDGTGYPRRLRGCEIPLSGRLCSLADVFDALTSARPYKPAWAPDRAIAALLSGAGTQFDPEVVDAFHAAYPEICAIRLRYGDLDRPAHERSPASAWRERRGVTAADA